MPEMTSDTFPIVARPGIQRDGTRFDADGWVDGQWTRFQRGRAKKMGGFRSMTPAFNGPIRTLIVHPHSGTAHIICGSANKIEINAVTSDGNGGGIIDVTPTLASGFVPSDYNTWQFAELYDGGGTQSVILAHAAPNLFSIDSETNRKTFFGTDESAAAWADSTAPQVSGGVCAAAPYAFVYGNDGFVAWCVPNTPNSWAAAGSGNARVTKSKIVYGQPIRGGAGQSPALIFISLDAVLRATFIGGTAVFDFDTISSQSSILSSSAVIEYDGIIFWPGVDRFLMYNGIVQDVPNDINVNWFFDNLNWNQRQKVWATKVPRFGEIWWFYPRGDSEECNAAIILNVREQTWYDTSIERSAGYFPQVFRWPVWADAQPSTAEAALIRPSGGTPATSALGTAANAFDGNLATTCTQTSADGNISYDFGVDTTKTIVRVGIVSFVTRTYNLVFEYSDANATNWTTMVDPASQSYTAGVAVYFSLSTPITARAFRVRETGGAILDLAEVYFLSNGYFVMQHELGVNKIVNNVELAIDAYIETNDISYVAKGPMADRWLGMNKQVILDRIEPDLIQEGDMTVTLVTRRYPRDEGVEQSKDMAAPSANNDINGLKMDMRIQGRLMALRFQSNTLNGFFEMGETMVKLKPGDASA